MPQRLQLRRTKGWRLPDNAVNAARPGRWGNPFRVDAFGRALAIELFRRALEDDWRDGDVPQDLLDEARAGRAEVSRKMGEQPCEAVRAALRGKDLACWCKPGEACHVDVLLRVANGD